MTYSPFVDTLRSFPSLKEMGVHRVADECGQGDVQFIGFIGAVVVGTGATLELARVALASELCKLREEIGSLGTVSDVVPSQNEAVDTRRRSLGEYVVSEKVEVTFDMKNFREMFQVVVDSKFSFNPPGFQLPQQPCLRSLWFTTASTDSSTRQRIEAAGIIRVRDLLKSMDIAPEKVRNIPRSWLLLFGSSSNSKVLVN